MRKLYSMDLFFELLIYVLIILGLDLIRKWKPMVSHSGGYPVPLQTCQYANNVFSCGSGLIYFQTCDNKFLSAEPNQDAVFTLSPSANCCFRIVEANSNVKGVFMLESLSYDGYYLNNHNGVIVLSQESSASSNDQIFRFVLPYNVFTVDNLVHLSSTDQNSYFYYDGTNMRAETISNLNDLQDPTTLVKSVFYIGPEIDLKLYCAQSLNPSDTCQSTPIIANNVNITAQSVNTSPIGGVPNSSSSNSTNISNNASNASNANNASNASNANNATNNNVNTNAANNASNNASNNTATNASNNSANNADNNASINSNPPPSYSTNNSNVPVAQPAPVNNGVSPVPPSTQTTKQNINDARGKWIAKSTRTLVKQVNCQNSYTIPNAFEKTNTFTITLDVQVNSDPANWPKTANIVHGGGMGQRVKTPDVEILNGQFSIQASTNTSFYSAPDCQQVGPKLINKSKYQLMIVYNENQISTFLNNQKLVSCSTDGIIIPGTTANIGKYSDQYESIDGAPVNLTLKYLRIALTDQDVYTYWNLFF